MRRDRYGEPVEEGSVQIPDGTPDHQCHRGWIDRDAARPCLICKPHLAPARRRPTSPDPDLIRRGVERCRTALRHAQTERKAAGDD